MQENDAYNVFFNSDRSAYDIVYVLKDGTRWKLDTHQNQTRKLNTILDLTQILRFECIMTEEANLAPEHSNYLAEISRELVPVQERGILDLENCFKNTCRQEIITGDEMADSCKNCGFKKGAQKLVELSRIGNYIGIQLNKVHDSQKVNHPVKLCLDRFMARPQSWQQVTPQIVYELVGLIGTTVDHENAEVSEEPYLTLRTAAPSTSYSNTSNNNSWCKFTF